MDTSYYEELFGSQSNNQLVCRALAYLLKEINTSVQSHIYDALAEELMERAEQEELIERSGHDEETEHE